MACGSPPAAWRSAKIYSRYLALQIKARVDGLIE